MGPEHTPVFWNHDEFFVIFLEDEDSQVLLVDEEIRVLQEDYVEEDKAEVLVRVFTSQHSAEKYVASVAWRPAVAAYIKITAVPADQIVSILGNIDRQCARRGQFLRVDALDLDGDVEQREIFFSRLVSKN